MYQVVAQPKAGQGLLSYSCSLAGKEAKHTTFLISLRWHIKKDFFMAMLVWWCNLSWGNTAPLCEAADSQKLNRSAYQQSERWPGSSKWSETVVLPYCCKGWKTTSTECDVGSQTVMWTLTGYSGDLLHWWISLWELWKVWAAEV